MLRLLDLFCGAGGCAKGYYLAGFTDITGIDIVAQPRYPYKFIQSDAIEYLKEHGHEYDVIHASPPCQRYTVGLSPDDRKKHPKYIGITRKYLKQTGKVYVIENVVNSPLKYPVLLCGAMFGLRVIRHILFEVSIEITHPRHIPHKGTVTNGDYVGVWGQGGPRYTPYQRTKIWSEAMGIDWMTRKQLSQAIPPAYTEYIGKEVIRCRTDTKLDSMIQQEP